MNRLTLATLALSAVSVASAQTADAQSSVQLPAADGYWDLAIALVSPLVVTGVAWAVPRIPKVLLPAMTPLVGIVVGLGLNAVAGAELSWLDMGKAGALAVFVREVFNQAVTKQLSSPPKPSS